MKTLNYSIRINAPKEKVFETILDKSVYHLWAEAWGEGMTYEGEWKIGSHIAFHDATQGGTKAVIEDMKAPDYIHLKHVAMVDSQANEVELTDDMMKKWMGTLEHYKLTEDDEHTTLLEVMVKTDEAFEEMMNGPWPKALQALKELSEQS